MERQRNGFDFAFIPAGPVHETVEFVQLGEELGYRCAWLPDQTFHRDPFVLLGLCARATRRIGLGLGITSPFTRLPVQIARAAGVIDEVADGRLRLGLGTANVNTVLRPLGIELKDATARLRNAATIIRGLLAGECVTFHDHGDVVREVRLDFVPPRPSIPIYIGTRGPKMLELAGEIADGVLVESLFNAGGMPYVFDRLRTGAERGSRPLSDIDVVAWQLIQVTDDEALAIDSQKPWMARSIQVGPPEAMRRIGIEEGVITGVTEAIKRGDTQGAIAQVTDDAVRCLMIVGRPKTIADRISRVFDAGANTVSLLMLGPMDVLRTTLVRFAREVMPAFR
jgi:5,10-methylenetetrahydromethanopterin reductase